MVGLERKRVPGRCFGSGSLGTVWETLSRLVVLGEVRPQRVSVVGRLQPGV